MNSRSWILVCLFAGLGLIYAYFFTEWLRPAPIEIASQVRFSTQRVSFGRPTPAKKNTNGAAVAVLQKAKADAVQKVIVPPNKTNPPVLSDRIGWSAPGRLKLAEGNVANVTFSLDDAYRLTKITVQDLPADGSAPQVMWQLKGKSRPVRSILYGYVPEGMQSSGPTTNVAPLVPGAPYRLILEAGRRRGTNDFTTAEGHEGG